MTGQANVCRLRGFIADVHRVIVGVSTRQHVFALTSTSEKKGAHDHTNPQQQLVQTSTSHLIPWNRPVFYPASSSEAEVVSPPSEKKCVVAFCISQLSNTPRSHTQTRENRGIEWLHEILRVVFMHTTRPQHRPPLPPPRPHRPPPKHLCFPPPNFRSQTNNVSPTLLMDTARQDTKATNHTMG